MRVGIKKKGRIKDEEVNRDWQRLQGEKKRGRKIERKCKLS